MWSNLKSYSKKIPTVEVHIPISPNLKFFTMVHYLIESFRLNSPIVYKHTKFIITVGADEQPRDLSKELAWSNDYALEWRWVDRQEFRIDSFAITAIKRFQYKFESDIVLMLDADVIVTGSLEELIYDVYTNKTFKGLISHASPFVWHRELPNELWWNRVFHNAGLSTPSLNYKHTFFEQVDNDPQYKYGPAYFNLGVLVAPQEIMSVIGLTIYDDMQSVDKVLETVYKCQIGVSLSIERHHIKSEPLDLKYNFPCTNATQDLSFYSKAQLADTRICHYLGNGEINKDIDFVSPATVQKMLMRNDLGPYLNFFQQKIKHIHQQFETYYQDLFNEGKKQFDAEQKIKASRTLVDEGRFREAIPLLEEATQIKTLDPLAHYLLAFSLQQIQYDEYKVLNSYEIALSGGFDPFWIYYNRGLYYYNLNKKHEAKADLEKAYQLNPYHDGFLGVWANEYKNQE
jgi:lipopolysaccharide biosynthesis glycosyltransferase